MPRRSLKHMASYESSDESTILIHGGAWKVKDIKGAVEWCLTQRWRKQTWKQSPALVHKVGGTTSQYLGQRFDSEKIDMVEDGWMHDHCEICSWTLCEREDSEEVEGYRNDFNSWLCTECFTQFVRDDTLNLKTNSEPGEGGKASPATS